MLNNFLIKLCYKILTTKFQKTEEDKNFLEDLISYQKKLVVHYRDTKETTVKLRYNIHEHFKDLREGKTSHLKNGHFTYSFAPKKDYSKAKKLFSREVLWYGRKGGKFFHSVSNLKSEEIKDEKIIETDQQVEKDSLSTSNLSG